MNATIYQLIAESVKDYSYPICFNFSGGHVDNNFPLLMGANTSLQVNDAGCEITFQSTFWKKAKNLLKK
jgi:muramoyltetrapeptide carboxypeptidase